MSTCGTKPATLEILEVDRKEEDVDDVDSGSEEFDAKEEKQLVRKLDLRIMPIICCIYLCSCRCARWYVLKSTN